MASETVSVSKKVLREMVQKLDHILQILKGEAQ